MSYFDKKDKIEPEVQKQPPRPLQIKVLDYAKEEDKAEIKRMVEDLIKKGVTDSKRISEILTSSKQKPITNLFLNQITSIHANLMRWKEKVNEKPESQDDKRYDTLEQQFKELNDKVRAESEEQRRLTESILDKLEEKSLLEIVDPSKTSENPQPEVSPELKAEHDKVETLKRAMELKAKELKFKKEQIDMSKRARDIMKQLQTADTKLKKSNNELDDLEKILAGEEIPEETPPKDDKVDDLTMDVFKILKEIKTINPRTLKNVVDQIEGITNRSVIKEVLYGGE